MNCTIVGEGFETQNCSQVFGSVMSHQQEASNSTNHQNATLDVTELELWLRFFGINSPLIILGLLIVLVNATILVVFARKRPLKIATNFFLVGMACTDIITGLFSIPFFIACNATYMDREDLCHVKEPFFAFTSLSTIALIATITADRYLAIMKPLRYKVLMTKKRAKLIITAIWLSAVFLSLLPLLWASPGKSKLINPTDDLIRADRIYTLAILCPIVLALPLMVYSYIRILKEIRRQRKKMREQDRFNGCSQSTIKQEVRNISIFCVMLAGYVFCWAPFAVIRLWSNFDVSGNGFPAPTYVVFMIMTLPFVTSFLNPCCYGYGKKDFRCAIYESSHCTSPRYEHANRNQDCTSC